MAEVPKKAVGGAFGQWQNANRAMLQEKVASEGGKGFGAVAKKASELWKAMSESEKEPWVKQFNEASAAYDVYKNSDSYVAPEKKEKREKSDNLKKDPDAPKKPVGGAYGIFSNEKRQEFTKIVEAKGEKGFGPVAKMTSEAFKALTQEQRDVYEEKFKEAQAKYQREREEYEKKKAEEMPASTEQLAPPTKRSPAKRDRATAGSSADAGTPPTKRGKGKKDIVVSLEPQVAIDPATLAAAEKAGLATTLQNLARRPEIAARSFDGTKLLEALTSSGGLVNKAKASLLGA